MKKAILILTHQQGFESDPVIDELRCRGINVFRFNSDAGDKASLVSFSSKTGDVEFVCDGKRIRGADVAAGWCQQLPPYLGQVSSKRECLQQENLLELQLSAVDLLPIPWFNRPRDVLCGSNKVNQIAFAPTVGLNVPHTLVSNDPVVIRDFARKQTIVAKNLATPWMIHQNETYAACTKIVDQSWLDDDTALSFAPIIYQEYRERKKDFRVVMIDGNAFAASCIPGPEQREDVRKGESTGASFMTCDFDPAILHKLHLLMDLLKLEYCAADFMEDQYGNIFFLEVNTCGAWWWLDRLYDGTICKSIADALSVRAGSSV